MPGTIDNINEIFLHDFPGKNSEEDIITSGKSRFHNQPQVLTPEFDIYTAKLILR